MESLVKQTAAASATVNTDLWLNEPNVKKPYRRLVYQVGCTGANAVGECTLIIRVNGQERFRFRNSALGLDQGSANQRKVRILVAAQEQLECVVVTAPTVSPILTWVDML